MGRMIFVVGNSRSGTTMLGRVLGRHGDVFTFNELHFFEQAWAPTKSPDVIDHDTAMRLVSVVMKNQRDGYYADADPSRYAEEAGRLLDSIEGPLTAPAVFAAFVATETAGQGKGIGCEQTPRNLYYLDELLALYPDARFVVMVRDPRDVLLSQKNRWKRRRLGAKGTPWWNALRTWAGYHPVTISLLWRSGVSAGDRFADDPRVCVLRFEDLLTEPEARLKRVCETVALEYDPSMLDVPRVGSSHEQDRPDECGLDPGAAGRWRRGGLKPAEIVLCQAVTADHMARHGYPLEPVSASVVALAWCRVTWVFKSALAFALNVHRIRHLRESLRRRLGR